MEFRSSLMLSFILACCEGLKLYGDDKHKLVEVSQNVYNFIYYDEDTELSLTCDSNETQGMKLMWLKGGVIQDTTKSENNKALSTTFNVNKKDSKSQIICQEEDKNGGINNKIIIHLLYKSNVLIYCAASIAVVILIMVILLIYVKKIRSHQKKIAEDKIYLEMTESFKSQSKESVAFDLTIIENTLYKSTLQETSFIKKPTVDGLINPTFSEMYTIPNDDNSYDNPSLNCIIPNTYCVPFIGNGDDDLFFPDIKFSNKENTANYENTNNETQIQNLGVPEKKINNNVYVNNELPSKANVPNEDVYVLSSDTSNQSNFYYEINS